MRCRPFVLFLPAALCVLLAEAAAQKNEAEQLYRDMEKKLKAAKTLEVVFESKFEEGERGGTFKGTLKLGEGNKGSLEMQGDVQGKEMAVKLTSDGQKLTTTMTPPGKSQEKPVPKRFGTEARTVVARVGPTAGMFFVVRVGEAGKEEGEPDIEKMVQVSDFKDAGKEKVGDREARVIEFKVTLGEKAPATARLWLDAKSHLPLKRALSAKKGEQTMTATETYSVFKVGGKKGGKKSAAPK